MEKLIIFLPILAAIISGFFGKTIGNRASQIITSLFVSISALLSIYVFYDVIKNDYTNNIVIVKWISSGLLDVNWSIKIDQLSAVMLVVVTLVCLIVIVVLWYCGDCKVIQSLKIFQLYWLFLLIICFSN